MTALVLSAGGMFGAWQAGAWSALESFFRPDIVVGASAGSLNAWLIACGSPASELAVQWLRMDAMARPHWRMPQAALGGFVDTSTLEREIHGICEGRRPRIRLGIVCVAMLPPRPVLFQDSEITWRHLAASCAVPAVMAPIALNGKLYVDGGALGPLPLWAASRMGATRIVAIDVLSPRPLSLRIPQAVMRSLSRHDFALPQEVKWKTIAPARLLGGWKEAAHWDRERTERWIEEGREAALKAADEVRELLTN